MKFEIVIIPTNYILPTKSGGWAYREKLQCLMSCLPDVATAQISTNAILSSYSMSCLFGLRCLNIHWKDKVPNITYYFKFLSVEYCNDLGPIDNGYQGGHPSFTCVSTLKYTCYTGYWLLGAKTLKCGINGQWDHNKPICVANSKKHVKAFECSF